MLVLDFAKVAAGCLGLFALSWSVTATAQSAGEHQADGARPAEAGAAAGAGENSFTNSIGMRMALIPAGEFLMGSPGNEATRESNEVQHRVKITNAFYMGVTEVTQTEWNVVMGTDPSDLKGDNLPVEHVDWEDCQDFMKRLSAKDGKAYRLPTEAEWEYACRAGTGTRFSSGDADSGLADHAWFHGNGGNQTHPVAEKKPNPWGLFDMHGNVWEWCSDWLGDYPGGEAVDPQGPVKGTYHVARGGSFVALPGSCRSALHAGGAPGDNWDIGFRVVCSSPPGSISAQRSTVDKSAGGTP